MTGQTLAQALSSLSASEGFELRGLNHIGPEAAPNTEPGPFIRSLHHLLDGYAYTLELAPDDVPGAGPGKPTRLTILGRSGHADDAANAQTTADDTSEPSASKDAAASDIERPSTAGGVVQLVPEMTGMSGAANASLRALVASSKQDCVASGQC